MALPPAPARVPSQRPLVPSVTSVTSVANDKANNEMTRGAVHRSPGICLRAEENPGKPQLGDRLTKRLWDQFIASNGVSFFQMRSVGSHSTWGREKERKKERTERFCALGFPDHMISQDPISCVVAATYCAQGYIFCVCNL